MVYLYCLGKSEGARRLRLSLQALQVPVKRIRQANLRRFRPTNTDLCVNWGEQIPSHYAGTWLNAKPVGNKFLELQRLHEAGIHTPMFCQEHPREPGWYARRFHHHAASDLLQNLSHGDYYTKHVESIREFRIHVFQGLVIRTALKIPRDGQSHTIFRTSEHYRYSYGTLCQDYISQAIRNAAKDAVKAVAYDFGAVDVGITPAGHPIIFEVNSRPGIQGGTLTRYAECIIKATPGYCPTETR